MGSPRVSASGVGGFTAGLLLSTTAPESSVVPSSPEPNVSVTTPETTTESPTAGAEAPEAHRPCQAAAASSRT